MRGAPALPAGYKTVPAISSKEVALRAAAYSVRQERRAVEL